MFLSGCTHMVLYVLPYTVSLLTIIGVGAEEAGVFFPHLLKPTPTPSLQSHSMARQGGGREGRTPTCALCPSQSTLSMSPRQQKKVMRTTPTMKELQMMVEHHLGQQQEGEEPEGAAESTGTQESCPPGIGDTAAESWLGTSGKAHKPAESIPNTQERGSEKPSTEEPSTHRPPLDSKGARSV
uniref:Protein phosphatase 1 regulatory subunit 1A n=1 Tax=Monodon monoceros TaxID=40151 RepID=A0A8C6BY31_MONMO